MDRESIKAEMDGRANEILMARIEYEQDTCCSDRGCIGMRNAHIPAPARPGWRCADIFRRQRF